MMQEDKRDRWRHVKGLFAEAADRSADERGRFLDQACTGDESLRREVEALLAAHDDADEVFEHGPAAASAFASAGVTLPLTYERLAPGRRIGPYEILDAIGSGGMGDVYRARDTRLHRDVALKVLPPALVAHPARRARFAQEARAASALEHPHIAVVHDVAETEGITFIVMELVRGEPLGALVARGPVSVSRAIELALEIAEALTRAHDIGIVHRDLKPANVMITADGHVKVIDFGLAKLVGSREDEATRSVAIADAVSESGMVVGTAAYMSPEQAQGAAVDHRSDIFSFGIVLQEMLTGASPFRRRSSVDTMHAILYDTPPPLPDSVGEGADHLQHVIGKCLAKTPGGRYQAMRDVAADLRTARRRLESAELRAVEGPPAIDRRMRIAAAVAVGIALVIAGSIWSSARRTRSEAARAAAIAQVKQLVDTGRFVDVWRVARSALERWPDDLQLEQMLRSTSQTVTLATDPPGADLAIKAYDDPEGEWLPIGTSPLAGVSLPLGMLRWRITKSGFDPLEARLEVGTPAAAAGRPDIDAKPIRLRPAGDAVGRMVFVPGGVFDGVQLSDYWIDQYEVTNREFKSFVDRGEYESRFRDRTGRPGPSTWELGTYPPGQEAYPVTGVSWFEADAFCRAAGKTLPTRYHWRRAFGEFFFAEVVTTGNFNGRGLLSTERLTDVGPFGTYGQAGNVKEWVSNARRDGQRYILGGAWSEPVYMAVDDDRRPPLDRADTNGFRCIKESAPSSDAAYGALVEAAPPGIVERPPVDDATFEIFRRFYSYEQTPLEARIESVRESEDWRRERASFAAAYSGERVPVNILIPKNASPPYQAVIWFPGSYALELKKSDGDLPFSYYFDFLPRSGRALVYPVYKGTYERDMPIDSTNRLRNMIVQWSQDLSRTVDYLNSRSDFDKEKIAYYGFSMGATGGAISAVALEPRFKAAIFLTGGLFSSSIGPEVDAVNFLPRMKMPFLMLGGRYDFYSQIETSQKPLFDLVGTPAQHKRQVVFEDGGHVPPRIGVIREVLDWLDRYLGPVEPRP